MAIPVSSGGKGICSTSIDLGVVTWVRTDNKVEHLRSEDFRKVVNIGDLLNKGSNNSSGFLKCSLVIPVGVE